MFSLAFLSLLALASAGQVVFTPHQQVVENDYVRDGRFYPYYEDNKENYPSYVVAPYNYKNVMIYPPRNSYFLRYLNKPKMEVPQPKVDYDSQDYYHLHDVNHHHMVNNIHDFKQKEVIRSANDVDYPYFPYSPMYYNKFLTGNMVYNKDYPFVNKYYGKRLEQEYVQPWKNFYDRYWDVDYIRNYYNKNLGLEYSQPTIAKSLAIEPVKYVPLLSRALKVDHLKPVISADNIKPTLMNDQVNPVSNFFKRYWDMDSTRNYYTRNLEYVQPITTHHLEKVFTKPIVSRNLGLDQVKPIIAINLDLENVHPAISKKVEIEQVETVPAVSKTLNVNYIKPVISEGEGLRYVRPVVSRNLDVDYIKPVISEGDDIHYDHPVISRNLDVDYIKPIGRKLIGSGIDFEVTGRNLKEKPFVPHDYNMNFEQGFGYPWMQFSGEGRIKRELGAKVGEKIELKHEIPAADLKRDDVANVELNQKTHIMNEHQEAIAHEQNPILRHDVQLNANVEHGVVHAEEQQSIQQATQRQARDTNTQSAIVTPQYVYYPYFLDPYLPVQTPLLVRSASYPNYYNTLLFKK